MDSSDGTALRRKPQGMHERSDFFRRRKKVNRLRKHVFKKLIKKDSRAMSVMKRSLSSFISTNRKVLVSRLPREHYAMEQTTLFALELLRYIKVIRSSP
ncbi:microtubule-associated serine/threonine-protein kinase 3-like [Tropilaelaps mercedesae]|uniref:Microtubule-associated serine/threonine-protein kinase 3-like n=1 Tax=Tropilaelaps mercedesae TaxID=418985 RepID=A0A1V9Y0F0_9ACAR|nr:microtubule-associated serine/threonine-protein kinase 3-like [Tropilaelaps mercedesae]